MRSGCGEAVDLRQMLLPRQHEFGGGQRVGELAGFLRDLKRVEAGDTDRQYDRNPDGDHISARQHKRFFAVPRQRQMEKPEGRGAGSCEDAERERDPCRQRGCRDQDRRKEKK